MIRRQFLMLAASAAAWPYAARAAAAAPAGPRPTEDFGTLPFMESPELSPDGTRLAAKVAVRGQQYLAITSLLGDAPPAVIATGDNDINWWSWVNDSWLIVGVGAIDRVVDTDFYVRRTVGVSADGKKVVPLAYRDAAQNADDVLWIATDGSPRILLALQKSVFVDEPGFWAEVIEVDVSTGKTRQVVKPHEGVSDWYADGAGAVRMGIGRSQEGRSSRLLYRDSGGGGFRIVDRANSRKNERLIVPSLFLPEAGQALAIDDKDGFDALYKLDLSTLATGERVFGVEGYDIDGIVTDRGRTKLLGVTATKEATAIHWLDPELAKMQAAIDQSVPGRRALVVSMDDKRQRFLIHLGAGDRPGGYYFFDVSDGRMQRIAYVNERIGNAKLHPVRTIRYKARDGLALTALLTVPAGREAKALPVVIMPHGGPFSRDSEEWDYWAQFLADRGYAVVQPNFRGSSGFGTAFAEKGRGQWGLAMQDDVNDALAEVVKLGIADGKRAAIVGGSYGGYAALRGAQRDGSLYRCAISFAGVSDLQSLVRYDSRFLNSGRGTDWLKGQAPDLKAVSPLYFAEQFSIPVLLVHGKKDQRVPVKQSREMAEKLKAAGKQVRYVEQPLGDHHLSREGDRLALLQEMEAFLKVHNPA